MFTTFLTTIATFAANKKVVGSWLVLITVSLAAIGDRVFIKDAVKNATVVEKLDNMQTTLDRIENQMEAQGATLSDLRDESVRVRTELDLTREANRKLNGKK